VHEAVGGLEDDRVGQLDAARVALGLDPDAKLDRRDRADDGAQRQRRLFAQPSQVAEAHCGDEEREPRASVEEHRASRTRSLKTSLKGDNVEHRVADSERSRSVRAKRRRQTWSERQGEERAGAMLDGRCDAGRASDTWQLVEVSEESEVARLNRVKR
jgi:hypothetical protein